MAKAKTYLSEKPRTVTADRCERSEGDAHDFYSEGDYWWPNPEDPDGPYVRRDGGDQPRQFHCSPTVHDPFERVDGNLGFGLPDHERGNLRQQGRDAPARMVRGTQNPDASEPALRAGDQGKHTGRSIGIIDTLHLVEVARALRFSAPPRPSRLPIKRRSRLGSAIIWIGSIPTNTD